MEEINSSEGCALYQLSLLKVSRKPTVFGKFYNYIDIFNKACRVVGNWLDNVNYKTENLKIFL